MQRKIVVQINLVQIINLVLISELNTTNTKFFAIFRENAKSIIVVTKYNVDEMYF